MKKILLIFILLPFLSKAQNTWVQRLYNLDDNYLNTDSLTGVRDIIQCKDGSLLVLAFINQDNVEYVFKVPVIGAPFEWQTIAGAHFGMSGHNTKRIFATSDSGYIAAEHYWDNSPQSIGYVRKYSKSGILDWEQGFSALLNNYDKIVFDVLQNNSGNFYALIGDETNDTLYEFDNSGNIISQLSTVTGQRMVEMTNGDLVVFTFDSLLKRQNISGTVFWTVPCYQLLSGNLSYSIIQSPSGIEKIDNANGNILWTKNYPFGISAATLTSDGGFIGVSGWCPSAVTEHESQWWTWNSQLPGTMARIDSMGDTLWTKHYDFPYHGLTSVYQMTSGEIVTGGAYIFTSSDYLFFARDYSAFIAMLDSTGKGLLETTSYIWPGNANNNMVCGFVDDALNTMIASGATGPARDTIQTSMLNFRKGLLSDYASNWVDTFATGVNYKHADFDGNGIIDTNDIHLYSNGWFAYYQPIALQAWRLANPFSFSSTNPDIQLLPERDTVAPGDLIRIFISVGENIPVDTLYGLTFSMDYSNPFVDSLVTANFYTSDLGSLGSDLYDYDFQGNNQAGWRNLNAMACRTNQVNVFNLQDTIGEILLTASQNITSIETVQLDISEFNALTYGQSTVPFNLIAGSVVIDPTFLSVSEKEKHQLKVYPNPASEKLFISNLPSTNEDISIEVFNSIGEKVKQLHASGSHSSISTLDLPNGIFMLHVPSDQLVTNTFFVVQH